MAHHQTPVAALGQRAQLFGLDHVEGQRLLDKNVLPGLQGVARQPGMQRRRRRDRYARYVIVAQYRIERCDRRVEPLG